MSLQQQFRNYSEQNQLMACDFVLIAASGGPDSMCLLHLYVSLKDLLPDFAVLHLNHALRGKDSDAEEKTLQAYCAEAGISFFARKTDVARWAQKEKIGIEEAGRNARYSFFDEMAKEYEQKNLLVRIAIAHQQEDRAETVLMNLFRGSGLDGLCVLKPIQNNIIRPLLFASRDQIEAYIKEHKIPFFVDKSNLENDFLRNRWRNILIPQIKKIAVKNPIAALVSTSELLCFDKDFMDAHVEEIFRKKSVPLCTDVVGIPCRAIRGQHFSIASRLVRRLFCEAFGNKINLSRERVEIILNAAAEKKGNRRLSLPGSRHAGFFNDHLYFAKSNAPCLLEASDEDKGKTESALTILHCLDKEYLYFQNSLDILHHFTRSDVGKTVDILDPESKKPLFSVCLKIVENPNRVVYNSRTWYCPMKEISFLSLRKPRTMDDIHPAGGCGSKPLRRFLTDQKVPMFIRSRLLLFAKESEVLWVPGLVHAKGYVDARSRIRFGEEMCTKGRAGEEEIICAIRILLS